MTPSQREDAAENDALPLRGRLSVLLFLHHARNADNHVGLGDVDDPHAHGRLAQRGNLCEPSFRVLPWEVMQTRSSLSLTESTPTTSPVFSVAR